MTTTVQTQSEYRDLPLDWLVVSPTNPRKTFDEDAMQELAASIRENGVLQPLLVRPRAERSFEIVFGERRYRGAAIAEKETVPVCIREMTDAQVLEAQLVENLQRQDVHPLHEAQGFAALLRLEEPKYSIQLISAKCGKSAGYVASRLRLTELAPTAVEAFTKDEIGLGHALLLAKLQPQQQEEALTACWQESYTGGSKAKRILLPVRHLREWIEHNILLELASAPFSKEDATLVPEAGSCVECPKRTGHNTLLFEGIAAQHDSCSDPACYAAKVDAHVKRTVAAKPKLVQITTAYGKPAEGSAVVPRNQYVEIRQEKPKNKYQQDAPEYKTCKFTTEAIVADGTDKGEIRKVCANPDCPVHHPKKQQRRTDPDAAMKAAQEKQRREEAQAQATGLRVLESHRRRGSRAPDETRPAFCRVAALRDAGRATACPSSSGSTASANRRTARPRRNCWRPFCPRPRKASWAAFWWRLSFCCPCTTRPTPRRFSAMPRTSTRWTWTPSPRQSSRNSRRRIRGRPARKPRRNRHRSPRRKQRHNPQPTRNLLRGQQDRLRIFVPAARLPALMRCPGRTPGRHSGPPDGQRRTALAGNTWGCQL